ncbi:MAG: pantoate kinase [Candidatus Hadarchaeia archaeon]
MVSSKFFVPGHISGFFQFCDSRRGEREIGSRNCGPCIGAGVETFVKAEKTRESETEVYINGKKDPAETTKEAIRILLKESEVTARAEIKHLVHSPISAGCGMSGAGALGATFAASSALNLDLSDDKLIGIAHEAEVRCKSGLGDVGPEFIGGLVIGLKPGAPPYGRWERISLDNRYKIVFVHLEDISTSDYLSDQAFRERVKKLGGTAMKNFLAEKSLENFMKVSRNFSLSLKIYGSEFEGILRGISEDVPLGASAALLGRTIFSPVLETDVEKIRSIYSEYFDEDQIMVTSIDQGGCRSMT